MTDPDVDYHGDDTDDEGLILEDTEPDESAPLPENTGDPDAPHEDGAEWDENEETDPTGEG